MKQKSLNFKTKILAAGLLFSCMAVSAQTQIGADIDGEAADDRSGNSVSLSSDGSTLAIGAPYNDGNGDGSGSVRVYKNMAGTWTQIGADIDGEAAYDQSGTSVSLSSDGSTLAIGAYLNGGNGNKSGSVRVYKNIAGSWAQVGADINGEAANDWSGSSVSLSGDGSTLAIGAYLNDGNDYDSGSVRVYKNMSGTWTKLGADIDGEAYQDYSGTSVSLSSDGSTLAIGAPYNGGNGASSGSVRVYQNIAGAWTKVGADIDGEAALDSGSSVSLSSDGSTLAIGAIGNDGNGTNSGSVRVYQNTAGTWTKVGADIDGEAADDWSGYSVSLSSDGSTLAIGAVLNDGNGNATGSVRVYKNMTGTWAKVGADIDGEAADDWSGYSVSISSDGATLAIGAFSNDENGINSGSVRVYDVSAAALNSDYFVLKNFKIQPNPVSEVVTISLEENLTLEKVNIYNTLGQLVKTEKNKVINVSALARGSYYFEVITNQGKATKTIVVQ
jgi:hypothetical protein